MLTMQHDFSDWFPSELDALVALCEREDEPGDEYDWTGSQCENPQSIKDMSLERAASCGSHFATYVERIQSPGWEDRLWDLHRWNLDDDNEHEAYHAAQQIWERRAGEDQVKFRVETVKEHAAGRWTEIMQAIGGLTADQVNGRHQPCPKCSGNDRFRTLNDFEETGAMLCNQCFNFRNGDGLSALQWLGDKPFPDVLRDVAAFLKIPPHLRSDHSYDSKTNKHSWADGRDRTREYQAWLKERREADESEPVMESIIWPISALLDEYPDRRPELIKGLLRRGEVFSSIAASKDGKTFLNMCLAVAVSHGDQWLGFDTVPGRVLMIDNELHAGEMRYRLSEVHKALQRRPQDIDIMSLRGNLCDINQLEDHLKHIEKGHYSLILLDALYRMLPPGTNESDNAAITAIWNQLDAYATQLDCAIGVVHHSSKGDQSGKAVTDVGSGAGSISRASDTHLVMRPHEQPGCAVLEARCRSFPSPEPVTIKFEWPVWYATTLAPEVKKSKPANELKQAKDKAEADAITLELVANNPGISASEIRGKTGWGDSRAKGSLFRLEQAGKIQSERTTKNGKEAERYSIKQE